MLGANIVVTQLTCFIYGQFNDLLSSGSESGLTCARFLTASNNEFHG